MAFTSNGRRFAVAANVYGFVKAGHIRAKDRRCVPRWEGKGNKPASPDASLLQMKQLALARDDLGLFSLSGASLLWVIECLHPYLRVESRMFCRSSVQ